MKIDDELEGTRWLGRPPRRTDSELVCLAVAQVLRRTAIWHNHHTGAPITRSLTAFDH